jgi:hypothetical protein
LEVLGGQYFGQRLAVEEIWQSFIIVIPPAACLAQEFLLQKRIQSPPYSSDPE